MAKKKKVVRKKTIKKKIVKRPKVVYTKERQTNVPRYDEYRDMTKEAMPPGKRIPKGGGKPYYEYRKNRTDKPGSLTGTNFKNFIKYKGYVIDKVELRNGNFEYWVNSENNKYHFFNAKSLSQAKKFIDRTIYLMKKIK
jgi:hypothetical protein